MDSQLSVNIKTVLFILLLIVVSMLFLKLMPFVILFYVAFLTALVMEPFVIYISKQKFLNKPLSRITSVLVAYLILIAVLIGALVLIAPGFVSQIQLLSTVQIPYINKPLGDFFNGFDFDINSYASGILSFSASIASGLFTGVLGLAFAIYISVQWLDIKKYISSLALGKHKKNTLKSIQEIETSLGGWAKGQLILMFLIGLTTTIGLVLLGGGSYAIALGLLAGLLEFIPFVGPIVTALVAFIIYLPISPVLAIAVVALFIVIQQIESNILVPKVMQKVSGFSPLIILIAITVGETLLGIIGVLMAVPTFMILVILVKNFFPHLIPANESE